MLLKPSERAGPFIHMINNVSNKIFLTSKTLKSIWFSVLTVYFNFMRKEDILFTHKPWKMRRGPKRLPDDCGRQMISCVKCHFWVVALPKMAFLVGISPIFQGIYDLPRSIGLTDTIIGPEIHHP